MLILLFGPVSGAHFNPVVSAVDWLLGRRTGTGLTGADTARLHRRPDPRRRRRARCWPTSCSTCPPLQLSEHARTGCRAVARRGRRHRRADRRHRRAGPHRPGRAVRGRGRAPGSARPTGSPRPPRSPTPRSPSPGCSATPSPASAPPRCRCSSSPRSVGAALGALLAVALYPDAPRSRRPRSSSDATTHYPPQVAEPEHPMTPDRRSCSSACTTPAAPRWPPPSSRTTPRRRSRSAPPGPHPPTRSTPPPSRPWPRSASTSRQNSPRTSPPTPSKPPTWSSPWAAATPARSSPASATSTGSSPTPPARALEAVRPIRDEIAARVQALLAELTGDDAATTSGPARVNEKRRAALWVFVRVSRGYPLRGRASQPAGRPAEPAAVMILYRSRMTDTSSPMSGTASRVSRSG